MCLGSLSINLCPIASVKALKPWGTSVVPFMQWWCTVVLLCKTKSWLTQVENVFSVCCRMWVFPWGFDANDMDIVEICGLLFPSWLTQVENLFSVSCRMWAFPGDFDANDMYILEILFLYLQVRRTVCFSGLLQTRVNISHCRSLCLPPRVLPVACYNWYPGNFHGKAVHCALTRLGESSP